MRNLKRALSLTLASVMLLGMMVVGSSAAAGYDDVAETDNVEAIEVLQAVQVMVGDERGFGPERPVNRAEMAVVMGKLLNLDYNYYEAICPFNDVYDWARGWVGACYANGIVSGRGEGVYDPGTTVTAVEAASMLMRALGYFKYQSDYSAGFETATVLQANKIRLFDGVDSTVNAPLTRNQVAQMALNALKTGMVEPDGNTLNFIDTNGNIIASGGKVNYVNITSNKAFATAISDVRASSMGSANDAPIVELGEQLYNGKLKLTDTTDDFERPARYWEYDAKAIGTYVKEELLREQYTVKVTGRTLHDLLGSTTIKDYDLVVAIDGVDDADVNSYVFNKSAMVRTNENAVGATGKGVLTQVFVDPDEGANGLITIAVINTYLAIAEEDFDDRTDDVDFRVYGIEPIPNFRDEYWKTANIKTGPTDESSVFKLELEDFPEVADVKDGDATLVTVAKGEVQTLAKPEILSTVQISSFKQGDWIVTGGTQYDFASAAEFEMDTLYDYTATDNAVVNLKDINYNVYLDKYGYAIGVEEVDRVDNYMFITGVDTNTVNRYAVQADASAIFLDGTMEAIKIDLKAARDLSDQATYEALVGKTNEDDVANVKGGSLINKWFTYSVGNDGVYEVVLVKDDVAVRENKARAGQFRTLTKSDNNINNTAVGPYTALGGTHGVDEIGRKSIALRGSDESNSPYYSVYGDDKSVYITAELENIMDANGLETYHVNIISGVDNVAVGIDEASIDVWSKDAAMAKNKPASGTTVATAYGSYVLFDDDGDIIGAVVVGEDSGATTNLVYTHKSSIESETDNNASGSSTKANSSKGDYTWTRKVVSNGEEVTLTEVGSGLSKLKSMNANTWYVVKYNAKGEVKNVYPAWDTVNYKGLISADAKNELNDVKRLEDQYVNDIEELNTATNENSLALYEVGPYNTSVDLRVGNTHILTTKPSVDNHTFYVKTETNTGVHQGFRVADDVKTVFIQTNNREESTIFESGYSRLEKIVDRLHDHAEIGTWAGTSGYHYELSAVMENGRAVVVVIRDLNGAGANFTYDRNRELRLYGNLFTAPNTVTGASNAVVTVGNQEVKPSGIGTDRFGSYTTYSIPQGSIVGIVDYDIDNVTPRFDYMTNMVYSDLNVRYLNRTITFTMPDYNAWIDGGREGTFRDSIYGTLGSGVPAGVTATFDGHNAGVRYEADYNTYMTIVISGLKADAKYEVSIGSPATVDNFAADANGVLTLRYLLNGNDMRNGYVTINHVKSTDGTVDPKPPVDPEAKDATVTVTKGLVNIRKDGKVISKITADFKMDTANMGVKTGDVLTIEPAEALDVKGAKDNGDGTFTVEETTVTISPKTGYIWHPLFRQYVDGDGNPTLVEWVSAMAVNSVAKRFSLARAAGDDLVDTDKGESKIDTNDLNWFFKEYQDGVRNFEFRTRLTDGTVFVENVSIVGTKITVTYDKTKFTADQYAEYLGVLDANVDNVVAVNPGTDPGPGPVEPDPSVMAEVGSKSNATGAYPVTFTQYIPADDEETVLDALTAEEIAAVLAETTGKEFDAKKVDLAKGAAVAEDGTKYTFTKKVIPTQVWKVTYNENTTFFLAKRADKDVTDVASGVKYLIDGSKDFATTKVDVDEGAATFTGTGADVVYVPAVNLTTTVVAGTVKTADNAEVMTAEIRNENGDLTPLATANHPFIKVGAVITLSKKAGYTLAEGNSIGVKVNGKVDKAVSIATATGTATITVANNADSELALEAVVNAVAEDVTVTLNGKEMTVNKKDDPSLNTVTLKGLVNEKGKPYTVIAKAENGSYVEVLANNHGAGTDGQKTVLLSTITTALTGANIDYTDGIVLETGYVIPATHTNWVAYSALKAAGANRSEVISGETFLPAGTEIYVEGKAGELLTEDNKVELDGERYDDGKGLASSKYAYAYALNSDLEDSTFSPLVTFKADDVALTIADKTAEVFAGDEFGPYEISKGEIVVNPGADVKLNVSVKSFELTGGDFDGLTNNDFKIERTVAKDALQFTLIAPKDIEKTKVAAENYEMILDINGIEVVVNAVVKARTETDDEKVAAAVEKLGTTLTIDGAETEYTDATVLDAVKTKVSAVLAAGETNHSSLVNASNGYALDEESFVGAKNGTEASTAGTSGSCTVTVTVKSGDAEEQVEITVTLKALGYYETADGINAVIAAVKNAVDAGIDEVTPSSGDTAENTKTALIAAINAKVDKVEKHGLTVTVSGLDSLTATEPNGSAGSVAGTITISCDGGTKESVTVNVSVPK